jgi:hypothetical protein
MRVSPNSRKFKNDAVKDSVGGVSFLLNKVCGLLGSRLEALVVIAAVVTEHGNYIHK